MTTHIHKWHCFKDDLVTCEAGDCNTIIKIADLLANTEQTTAKITKVQLLSKQLFAGELKKPAHESAYAWVRQNSAGQQLARRMDAEQGVLL